MERKFLTYDEVCKDLDKSKCNLLLGNGFSRAYDENRFSFTSLLDSAVEQGIVKENSSIRKVFLEKDTSDFEEVIKILELSSSIINIYKPQDKQFEEFSNELKKDSEDLKHFLIKIITNNHPDKSTSVLPDELKNAVNFLMPYKSVYTLNYDLLLYWVTETMREMIDKGECKSRKAFTDGFGEPSVKDCEYVEFNNHRWGNSCFFLHGALHIFDAKDRIIKKTFLRTGKSLKEQIRDEMKKGYYPIFVSEGDSEQKKTKIIHNAYLNHCYKSFAQIGGDLVVFGTVLKQGDQHIRDAILKNKTKRIFFGVSSLEKGKKELGEFIIKAEEQNKEVFFYDYRSVDIWRKPK